MTDEQQLELDLAWEKMVFKNGKKVEFKLDELPPNANLPRRFPDKAFIKDMELYGQENPILVAETERGFVVVDGNKRVKAARSLGWNRILSFVRQIPYHQAVIMRARMNNLRTSNDMSDIIAIQEIMTEYPTTANVRTISHYTGINQGRVKQLMRQAKLSPVLHNAVLDGLMTEETLHSISKVSGAEEMALAQLASDLPKYERHGEVWVNLETQKPLAKPPILVTLDDVRDVQRIVKANALQTLDLGLKVETRLQGYAACDEKGNFLCSLMDNPDDVRVALNGQEFILVQVRQI